MPDKVEQTGAATQDTTTGAGAPGTTLQGAGAKPEGGTPAAGEKKPEGAATKATEAATNGAAGDDASVELGITEKNGKKFISMPYDSFKERVAKSTKKELKSIFGTSDQAALLGIKKKYDDWEKEAEARKRAEMSERQKLEADRDAA